MRTTIALLTAGALAALLPGPGEACDKAPPSCGQYGTSFQFEPTPSAAAQRALREEKLVFVLHVSGNFEESEFT